jgi:hypothetical protein
MVCCLSGLFNVMLVVKSNRKVVVAQALQQTKT